MGMVGECLAQRSGGCVKINAVVQVGLAANDGTLMGKDGGRLRRARGLKWSPFGNVIMFTEMAHEVQGEPDWALELAFG